MPRSSRLAAALALLTAALSVPALATRTEPDARIALPRCAVADPRLDEPLRAGETRVLAIDAGACSVPAWASALEVEVRAVGATAPAVIVLQPAGSNDATGSLLSAVPGAEARTTVLLRLEVGVAPRLAAQAIFGGTGGTVGLGADVVAYLETASTFSGTTGFITTRPKCVPPKYTADNLNYLQGAEPILLDNGDVTMLVGSGRCCLGTRHWEGIFSLNYPAAGRAASPRFNPIWATNDFSQVPSRKEAEIGFPSALWYNGKWRVAFTTTFLPFHRSDVDRASRLDLANLTTRATPSQVTNAWVKPINPACRATGSCPGRGSGFEAILTLHPNGDLYLYHSDGNFPACPSAYVRHKVGGDMSVNNNGHDGCVQFEGLTKAPFLISDIARTQDGRLLLLIPKPEGLGFLAEWESTGGPTEIGLRWAPTGRVWPAPEHPSGAPWIYYVRDAAFLKDKTRTIVEPGVVVAQISDGTTYQELTDVQLGRWYLFYWADENAVLPPTFGGAANACAFQGVQESASCTEVRGWAWDPLFPNTPISVDVLVDGVLRETIPATELRADITRGDNRHGYRWPIPTNLRDGKNHKITVRAAGSTDLLSGKTKPIRCR